MRFLADENMPLVALGDLRAAGFDVLSASEVLAGRSDHDVLALAKREDRIVITFDKDFAEIVFREGKTSSGVILLRVRPASPSHVSQLLLSLLQSDRRWDGHFSVVTEDRIRMVPLP